MAVDVEEAGGHTVHLALRFHVNFYHSYRGDSLDDRGIGKDIRVIRGILDDLDRLGAAGIPVRAAWDIENYWSLQVYMPRYAPDLIERIASRVKAGLDEVELMSWNNGLLTAHDEEEFRAAVGMAISNEAGSGVADLFPSWTRIARPQECMWNARQIGLYRDLGVEAVSLYYSAIPFNGFGSFVPPLPMERRYNPLRVVDPETGATMRLLPAYNHGDIAEHGASLRGWLRALRKAQLALDSPVDFILLVDMDADDSFWEGYVGRHAPFVPPSLRGLESLVRSVADLPWLEFDLPWAYLAQHGDSGEIEIDQDLADGAFDGYSSWAEKAENPRLWSVVHVARRKAGIATRLAADLDAPARAEVEGLLRGALEKRLLAMSTTHFGMASPVMNVERLGQAFARAGEALAASEGALSMARALEGGGTGLDGDRALAPTREWWYDPRIDGLARGKGTIARGEGGRLDLIDPEGSRLALRPAVRRVGHVVVGDMSIGAGGLSLEASIEGVVARLGDRPLFAAPLSRPWITHRGARRRGRVDSIAAREVDSGAIAELEVAGRIVLPGAGQDGENVEARWRHRYALAVGIEGFRVDVDIDYPKTAHRDYGRSKANRLARDWDARWTEVAPFELEPLIGSTLGAPARVWKHDFTGRVSSYELCYHRFGPNREPDSLDNQITDSWVAVSGAKAGLLVAQSDEGSTNFAFCPMRVRIDGTRQGLHLNPFGSYHGRQWRYPTATTGLGRLAAILMADNLDPYAPSWEGQSLSFSLFLLPYAGGRPPEALRRDALVFASKGIFA